ncbi:MAG: hypothetical protein H6Q99_2382 [Proteobacteria bacterium]|nr:hypothetical protein [Pseudomonadota bacterium]
MDLPKLLYVVFSRRDSPSLWGRFSIPGRGQKRIGLKTSNQTEAGNLVGLRRRLKPKFFEELALHWRVQLVGVGEAFLSVWAPPRWAVPPRNSASSPRRSATPASAWRPAISTSARAAVPWMKAITQDDVTVRWKRPVSLGYEAPYATRMLDRKALSSRRRVSDCTARSFAEDSTCVAALDDSEAACVMPTTFCDT